MPPPFLCKLISASTSFIIHFLPCPAGCTVEDSYIEGLEPLTLFFAEKSTCHFSIPLSLPPPPSLSRSCSLSLCTHTCTLTHTRVIQDRQLGMSADQTEWLCALVKHEAREECTSVLFYILPSSFLYSISVFLPPPLSDIYLHTPSLSATNSVSISVSLSVVGLHTYTSTHRLTHSHSLFVSLSLSSLSDTPTKLMSEDHPDRGGVEAAVEAMTGRK